MRPSANLLERVWKTLRGGTTLKELIAPDRWSTWQADQDQRVQDPLDEPVEADDDKPTGRPG